MEERTYRVSMGARFPVSMELRWGSSDIWLGAGGVRDPAGLRGALAGHQRCLYQTLEAYAACHPGFRESLVPRAPDRSAPGFIREMLAAGRAAGTGPMAAVAGVFAEEIGRRARTLGAAEVVVENGGDLYLDCQRDLTVQILAGPSPLSGRVHLRFAGGEMPVAVCTSSASVGHSLSLGQADALVVAGRRGAWADAFATAIANRVDADNDLAALLEESMDPARMRGILAVRGGEMAVVGTMEVVW